jgi:hypothetical protein
MLALPALVVVLAISLPVILVLPPVWCRRCCAAGLGHFAAGRRGAADDHGRPGAAATCRRGAANGCAILVLLAPFPEPSQRPWLPWCCRRRSSPWSCWMPWPSRCCHRRSWPSRCCWRWSLLCCRWPWPSRWCCRWSPWRCNSCPSTAQNNTITVSASMLHDTSLMLATAHGAKACC